MTDHEQPAAGVALRPALDEPLFWFLNVLDAVGREVSAGDNYCVVAAFCDDRGDDDDTYNVSEKAGWSRSTHSGWGDGCATVEITDAGRAVLWAAKAERSSAPTDAGGAVSEAAEAGREALWKLVHEVWQLLDDGETNGRTGATTVDQDRLQAVSDAMDALEALVPDSEGPFWGGFPVNYFWKLGAGK